MLALMAVVSHVGHAAVAPIVISRRHLPVWMTIGTFVVPVIGNVKAPALLVVVVATEGDASEGQVSQNVSAGNAVRPAGPATVG